MGSSRFFVSVSENFYFAGGDLKLCPRSNFTFFFFCIFLLLGAVFMSLSFQFFLLNSWFEYYLSFVLRFLEISVHFRNFFCKSLVNSE